MNWFGINLSKTPDVNNQIIDFEIKRKVYKKDKLEFGVSFNFEFPFSQSNKRIQSVSYNQKIGFNTDFNYILSNKAYMGIGIQFEKYRRNDKFYINPKLISGFVINKRIHLVAEVFIEYNKVYQVNKDENPTHTVRQVFENMDYKTTIGVGIKKSIFHPKSNWKKHKKRKGIIQTL